MTSAEAQAEIERMLAGRREAALHRSPTRAIEDEREAWESAARGALLPEGARFHDVDADGVPSEWMEVPQVKRDRVVLLLHGGGYVSGSSVTHRKLAAGLSRAGNARVLTPNYRLAPEHPFPSGVEDAIKAYGWLVGQGIPDIIVAADSAGAGLAMSMLVTLRDTGVKLPRAAVLMSAWTDLTASSPSHITQRDIDVQVTPEDLRDAGRLYIGAGDPADSRASTLFADATGLPPLLLQVGGDEVLLDDSRIFAERARLVGVDATLEIFEGMWHVFQFHAPEVPEAQAAMDGIAAFIRTQLGD